jgi:aldehyde dehydrogenase (NAD+)
MTTLEYEPAAESHITAGLRQNYGLFVGGKFVTGAEKESVAVTEPATTNTLAHAALATDADVDRAARAARNAFDSSWGCLPAKERAKFLFRISRLLQDRGRQLSTLQTMETGRPIRLSRNIDLPLATAHLFYYAGWADKLEWVSRRIDVGPIGVVGQIFPEDSPLVGLVRAAAPALAAGNTVILLPHENTPLTTLLFADICREADLPPGTVNVLTGAEGLLGALVRCSEINHLSFTGDMERGRRTSTMASGEDIGFSFDICAEGSAILFEDAPIDQAIEGVIESVFLNRGQTFCPVSRLFVQEPVLEDVIQRLRTRIERLSIGDPLDMNTDVGPLRSSAQLDEYTELLRVGEDEGASRWSSPHFLPDSGYWYNPTIFTEVAPAHSIGRQTHGIPVLPVSTFRTAQEAVDKVNRTPGTTTAAVWTDKGSKGHWMADMLKASTVWVNTTNAASSSNPSGRCTSSSSGDSGGGRNLLRYLKETGL